MLRIELRRPIIPPSSFTMAYDEKKKKPLQAATPECLATSTTLTLHLPFSLPVSPACLLSSHQIISKQAFHWI